MGLREKVALILLFNTLLLVSFRSCLAQKQTPRQTESGRRKQTRNVDSVTHPPIVITIRPQVQPAKARNKFSPDQDLALHKTFNFPDVEYPTASTPRPPFYLQEANILQRNPIQRAAENPSSTTVQYPRKGNKNDVNKAYNSKQKQPWSKTTKKPAVTINFSEYAATPQPYRYKEEGAFPDVEYPLNIKDTWKPSYWNHIPVNRPQHDVNKNAQEISPNSYSSVKSSKSLSKNIFGNGKNSASKLQQTPSNSLSASKTIVNNNYHQTNIKEELGKNNFIKTDSQLSMLSTQNPIGPKMDQINNNQHTTRTPLGDIQSTSNFVLTPYTTLYFDSTPPYLEENNKQGKKRKKKKLKKKNNPSSTKPKINDENFLTLTTPMPKTYEIDSHEQKDFGTLFITSELSNVNLSEKDSCPYKFNDTISPSGLTLPARSNNETILLLNDDNTLKISNDKAVAAIFDGMDPISNTDNKGSSYSNDNVGNSNKSTILDNKAIDYPFSYRENENVVPSVDEEFTTDSFPDFDENILSIYSLSTSTMSPLSMSTSPMDNTWVNSKVMELSAESLYPDELEQFYIMVP